MFAGMFTRMFPGTFKRLKTPHRQPMWHLAKMYGLFVLAAAITIACHLGAHSPALGSDAVARSLVVWPRLATALSAGALSLVFGVAVTASVRRLFNLVQTGRVIQYVGFWLSSWAALVIAAHWFGAFVLDAPALAGLAFFAIAFGSATALGVVPWRGRTWMPMKKPVRKG